MTFERSITTTNKRFNTCKITVKNNDIVISQLDSSVVTVLSRAQWKELTDFVDNELNYRNDVIDYLKNKCQETNSDAAILKNAKAVDRIVELYGKRCRENIGNSKFKTKPENITDAIVDYIVLYASD